MTTCTELKFSKLEVMSSLFTTTIWPVTTLVGDWKGKITDKVESILRKRSIQIGGKTFSENICEKIFSGSRIQRLEANNFLKKSVKKYFQEVESRLESKEFSDKICESDWPQCCFWCCRELSHCRNNKSKQINSTRCPRDWISFLKDFSFWFNLPGNVLVQLTRQLIRRLSNANVQVFPITHLRPDFQACFLFK